MRALNKAILIGLTGLLPLTAIGQSADNTYDCGNPPALVKQAIEQTKDQGASAASKYFMKNPDAAEVVSNYLQQCSIEKPEFLGGLGCDICAGTLSVVCSMEVAPVSKSGFRSAAQTFDDLMKGAPLKTPLAKCIIATCGSACSIP